MANKNNKKIRLLQCVAGLLGAGAVTYAWSSTSIDQIISDQRSRQIARQVSSNITSRVASDLSPGSKKNENPNGASADRNSWMPDSVWSSYSYTNISDDSANLQPFSVDLHQTTSGIDKNIGNFYYGATFTYAGATADFETDHRASAGGFDAGADLSAHSVGATPYLAYVINKNLFLSAMTGYNYVSTGYKGANVGNTQSTADSYTSELDLNGLHVVNQWVMKGKIGARYGHSYTTSSSAGVGFVIPQSSRNADEWTYLTDVEAGYNFKNGVRLYTGALFEYNNPKPNNGQALGVFYYSAGADYSVNKKLTLGAKVQTDLNNNTVDITTVALTGRLALD